MSATATTQNDTKPSGWHQGMKPALMHALTIDGHDHRADAELRHGGGRVRYHRHNLTPTHAHDTNTGVSMGGGLPWGRWVRGNDGEHNM